MAGWLNNLVGAVAGRTVVVVQNLTVGRDFNAGSESSVDAALQRTTRLERDVGSQLGLLITGGPIVVLLLPPPWSIRIGIGLAIASIANAVVATYLSVLTRRLAHQKLFLSGALAENAAAAAASNWLSKHGASEQSSRGDGRLAHGAIQPVPLCVFTTALVASALFASQQPIPAPEVYADDAPAPIPVAPPPAIDNPTPWSVGTAENPAPLPAKAIPIHKRTAGATSASRPNLLPDVTATAHGPPPKDVDPSVDCGGIWGWDESTTVENGHKVRDAWPRLRGRLPRDTILRTITLHLPAIRGCTSILIYVARVGLDLTIRPDGFLDTASVTYSNYYGRYAGDESTAEQVRKAAKESADCLAKHFAEVGFPSLECGGGATWAKYKVVYHDGTIIDNSEVLDVEDKYQ